MSARILAVANQKGGVGKTTTAINLATALAVSDRKRILLVDMDPQANLTSGVGLKGQAAEVGTVYHALMTDVDDASAFVLPTRVEHLSLMPADRNLTGAEVELVTMPDRERRILRGSRPSPHGRSQSAHQGIRHGSFRSGGALGSATRTQRTPRRPS